MDEKIDLKMAELLCSKLCHDLISPIGAVNNGLEFLDDGSPDMVQDAKFLIGQSARQAADKLAYFRLALGGGGAGDAVEMKQIAELIEKLCTEKKLECVWSGIDLSRILRINKSAGKFLLNITLIAADCLPRGGKIEFQVITQSEIPDLEITINGERSNLRDDVKSGFDIELSEEMLTVRNVLAFYCMKLAKNCGKTLNFNEESPSVIKFRYL